MNIGGRCFSIKARLNGGNFRVKIEILVAQQPRWHCLDYFVGDVVVTEFHNSDYAVCYNIK